MLHELPKEGLSKRYSAEELLDCLGENRPQDALGVLGATTASPPVVLSSGVATAPDSHAIAFMGYDGGYVKIWDPRGGKIPQTETGMDGLKDAYRKVLAQAVSNGILAPGAWNSSTVFGNVANLHANVLSIGYYVYSQPVDQQLQTDRAARKAPVVQIAAKEAGALHSSSVVVQVNP